MIDKISMRAARVNADISQGEMARRLGKSQNTVLAWELGRKAPRIDELQAYCNECGCSISDIALPTV